MRRHPWLLVPLVFALSCNAPPGPVVGTNEYEDSATPEVLTIPYAGKPELEKPTPSVTGSMMVNGKPYELTWGYGMPSGSSHVLRLITDFTVVPRIQMTLVVPADSEPGFSAHCGDSESILFGGQWIVPDAVAFFTRAPRCTITLSRVARGVDDVYAGEFSGKLERDPRSIADAGFTEMDITDGRFTVIRRF